MELVIKHFNELTTDELFEIYKLRVEVFVVEQNCPYQDVDYADRVSYHLYLRDEEGIQAYSRVIPAGAKFEHVSIGRLLTIKRRAGLGRRMMEESIKVAREKFNADLVEIEGQVYVKKLYEELGFVQTSDEFLDDGIPHVKMELHLRD